MIQKILILFVVIFLAFAGWNIGGRLSTDALGLALGVMFGVMVSIPIALIAVTGNRNRQPDRPAREPSRIAEVSLLPVVRPTNYWLVSEEIKVRK